MLGNHRWPGLCHVAGAFDFASRGYRTAVFAHRARPDGRRGAERGLHARDERSLPRRLHHAALRAAGVPMAVATDFNPGSSPSGNMNFVNSLACIQQRMLPNEVVNASTLNGAFAMDVQNELGSIAVGKKASFIITKPLNSLAELFYYFGENNIDQVIVEGKIVDAKAN